MTCHWGRPTTDFERSSGLGQPIRELSYYAVIVCHAYDATYQIDIRTHKRQAGCLIKFRYGPDLPCHTSKRHLTEGVFKTEIVQARDILKSTRWYLAAVSSGLASLPCAMIESTPIFRRLVLGLADERPLSMI